MNFFQIIVRLFNFDQTNWKTIILCFITAIVFWSFNALNKDYITNLRFPIQFEFDKEEYVPIDELPRSVLMNVGGNGWDLLQHSINFNLPKLVIPLERPTTVKRILGSTLPSLLAGQFRDLQIHYVITDTLYLNIDRLRTKKIRLTVNPERFTYETGFGKLDSFMITPDSVTIEGPKSILDTLSDPLVLDVSANELDSDFEETVEVTTPDYTKLDYKPSDVEVYLKVVQWIQIPYVILFDREHIPSKIRFELEKDSVSCIAWIPEEKSMNFQQTFETQKVLLNFKKMTKGYQKVLPQVINLPDYAQLLHVDSVTLKLY